MKQFRILVINPGSTSTKLAVFENGTSLFEEQIRHNPGELASFKKTCAQYNFRKTLVLKALKRRNIALDSLDAVVGRGGLLRPLAGGTYKINRKMLKDLRDISIWGREHASNLGALIAYRIGKELGIAAFVVDPVSVDELQPLARISGLPGVERRALFHALNVKAQARRVSRDLRKKADKVNLVIAHMGGGISVCAYRRGRVIDVNNAVLGMGPFSPQRVGALPVADLVKLCFSGKYSREELERRLVKHSGLIGYLGTDNVPGIEKKIKQGDKRAGLILEAMAYQIAKEIAAMAAVLKGDVDAVVLTGGLAFSKRITGWIRQRVSFIASVLVYPGEEELRTLVEGGLRVLRGQEDARTYR